MGADKAGRSGGRFRVLLQRALRGDEEAAWELLQDYGAQLLHLALVKRRERRPDGSPAADAPRLVAQLWEFVRPESSPADGSIASSTAEPSLPDPLPNSSDLADAELPTVGVSSAELPTLGSPSLLAGQQSPEEQLDSARRRWKHLLVTPALRAQVLHERLQGAAIADIAAQLGLAELVVKRILEQEVRQEGHQR